MVTQWNRYISDAGLVVRLVSVPRFRCFQFYCNRLGLFLYRFVCVRVISNRPGVFSRYRRRAQMFIIRIRTTIFALYLYSSAVPFDFGARNRKKKTATTTTTEGRGGEVEKFGYFLFMARPVRVSSYRRGGRKVRRMAIDCNRKGRGRDF